MNSFGDYMRHIRIQKKLTLRSFCEKNDLDTAYVSRLENNKIKPPSSNKLNTIALALGLKDNSEEWTKFFDLAHQARNELPSDISQKAKEALILLPAFLRTRDRKKLSNKRIKELVDFLSKGEEG